MAPILGYWSIRGLAQPARYLLEFTGTKYEDKLFDCGPAPSYDKSEWTSVKETLGLEFPNLVQPIRFMLEYAGAKYEEKQYNGGPAPDFSRAEWTSVKDTIGLDFPNLPYYIDGDLKITESGAITRHLARKYGLDGTTEEEKIKIDMAIGIMADLGRPQAMLFYSPDFETAKVPFIAEINTPLQKVSKLLGANNYIAGDKISFADFALFELLERYELLVPTCLSGFTNLQAFKKRFTELPAIKKYMASPAFLKLKDRFNGRRAQIGTGTY